MSAAAPRKPRRRSAPVRARTVRAQTVRAQSVRRFEGRILGVGTTAGPRIVVGIWDSSPFGAFADVMLEDDAVRVLLAPPEVAAFVAGTYGFDDVRTGAVSVTEAGQARLRITAPGLTLDVELGGRTVLGRVLRTLPRAVATHPRWARAIAPLSGVLQPGVRTWGTAGSGRHEAYGAWDHRAVLRVRGTWQGRPLGDLAPLDPPVRFGFGSTPRTPSLTSLTTTVIGD